MQHGLIDMAGTFFFNEPELSPAYTLAQEGYDLWFGNSRGTILTFELSRSVKMCEPILSRAGAADRRETPSASGDSPPTRNVLTVWMPSTPDFLRTKALETFTEFVARLM